MIGQCGQILGRAVEGGGGGGRSDREVRLISRYRALTRAAAHIIPDCVIHYVTCTVYISFYEDNILRVFYFAKCLLSTFYFTIGDRLAYLRN